MFFGTCSPFTLLHSVLALYPIDSLMLLATCARVSLRSQKRQIGVFLPLSSMGFQRFVIGLANRRQLTYVWATELVGAGVGAIL